MIPIRLSLQGVFSYVNKQEIDFTELTESGLFGIFGKVGSGKSSIVDAITYVLYNNNYRLSSSGMLKNMMNLSAPMMEIEYDFRVGAAKYRFSVSCSRKRNSEEPKQPVRSASCWDAQLCAWVPTDKGAEAIIGLGYDDFKRAVIIPQNNFQEFLELKSTERTDMMQKIFRLDRFDLAERIKHLKDSNDAALKVLLGQLQMLDSPDPEKVASMEQQLRELETEIKIKQKQLAAYLTSEAEFAKLRSQLADLDQKKVKLQILEEKEVVFQDKKGKLQAYQSAVAHVKPMFDRRDGLLKEQSDLQSSIHNVVVQLGRQEEVHAHLIKRLDDLKIAYENRDQLKARADDLKNLLKIRQAEAGIQGRMERKSKGLQLSEELSEKIEKDRTEHIQLQHQLAELDRAEIDIVAVNNVLNWHKMMDGYAAQIMQEELRLKQLRGVLDARLQQKNALNRGRLSEIAANSSVEFIENQLNSARRELETHLKSVREQAQKVSQQLLLQKHVQDLHQGEACPLCGATEHPEPLIVSSELQEMRLGIQKTEESISEEMSQLDQLKDGWINLKHEIIRQEEQVEQSASRLNQLLQLVEAERIKFEWPAYSPKESSKALQDLEIFQKQSEQKRKLSEKAAELLKSIDSNSVALISYQAKLQEIDKEISNLNGGIVALQMVMNAAPENYSQQPTEGLSSEVEQLIRVYNELASKYEDAQNQLNSSAVLLAELKTRKDAEMRQLADLQLIAAKLAEDIQRAIKVGGFESPEEVQQLLLSGIDAKQWQMDIENYFQNLRQAQADFSAASREVDGKTYHAEEHKALESAIQTLQGVLDAQIKQSGSLETEIKRLKVNISRQMKLIAEKEKLDLRAENLYTLENLFKAKAFVNFASGIYLLNLVQNANERFRRMTKGQLLLQLDKDNGFEVLDLLNDGKTRSVRTLSGGQKFQAALCLALALADGISQGTHENFFFMDEGFGALDKESMQVVFETLQSLRKENRVVGLISHVEDMQQEMTRYITVHRDEQKGSWIEIN